ncbi:MAG: hypothetical protein R3316_05435 [Rhodovibrionaceae bacterium]|nr:hypothetical protein [Rhodovibrionaceae bacterium]
MAPSPHNTQPWAFRVEGDVIEVLADTERNLGPLDPYWREMTIGLGCAVEGLVTAAAGEGYTAEGGLFPDTQRREVVARVRVRQNRQPRGVERYRQIAERHTHRGPYEAERTVPKDAVRRLSSVVDQLADVRLILLRADSQAARLFAEGTVDATKSIVADAELMAAARKWERHPLTEVKAQRDGISVINAGLPEEWTRALLTSPWLPDILMAEGWVRATRDVHCATAGFFGALAVRPPVGRQHLLEAGRLWQRLHLEAASMGMAMQPLNQLMEMADRDRALGRPSRAAASLARISGGGDWRIVFGFRGGYAAEPAPPSPRRGVRTVTVSG